MEGDIEEEGAVKIEEEMISPPIAAEFMAVEADEKPAKKKTDDIDWEAIAKENEEKRVSFQSEAQRERNKSKKLEQQLAELTEKVNGLQQPGANDSEIDDLLAEIRRSLQPA